jgi:dehydration protein DpgD
MAATHELPSEDDTPPVRCEKRGRVAYITLQRPASLNALDLATHRGLAQIWDDFENDAAIWVGVLTGAGDRSFSVGQDLKELAARIGSGAAQPSTFGSRGGAGWPRLTERFELSKPIIARVNGYALGGGLELALACDIIVAAEHATFALPEARLGLIAGAGGVFRLTRQIPFKIALGYLMTGRQMSAARAFQLGLVNEVAPMSELDAAVDRWVTDILRCAPLSIRAIKEAALKAATLPLDQAFTAEYRWEERRMRSRDAQEGPRAFVEKREAIWSAE